MKVSGMKIEDEFIFISGSGDILLAQRSPKNQGGKTQRQIEVEYLRDTNQLHIRALDESVVPPSFKRMKSKTTSRHAFRIRSPLFTFPNVGIPAESRPGPL